MSEKIILTNYSNSELLSLFEEAYKKAGPIHIEKSPSKKLNQNEAAKFLGISVQTLIRWKRENLIPYYQIGRSIFFIESELLEALRKNPRLNK